MAKFSNRLLDAFCAPADASKSGPEGYTSQGFKPQPGDACEIQHNPQYGGAAGKKPNETVTIIDSQSVKTTEEAQSNGFDAGKKNKGKKEAFTR